MWLFGDEDMGQPGMFRVLLAAPRMQVYLPSSSHPHSKNKYLLRSGNAHSRICLFLDVYVQWQRTQTLHPLRSGSDQGSDAARLQVPWRVHCVPDSQRWGAQLRPVVLQRPRNGPDQVWHWPKSHQGVWGMCCLARLDFSRCERGGNENLVCIKPSCFGLPGSHRRRTPSPERKLQPRAQALAGVW
jgi:hypothetical protein